MIWNETKFCSWFCSSWSWDCYCFQLVSSHQQKQQQISSHVRSDPILNHIHKATSTKRKQAFVFVDFVVKIEEKQNKTKQHNRFSALFFSQLTFLSCFPFYWCWVFILDLTCRLDSSIRSRSPRLFFTFIVFIIIILYNRKYAHIQVTWPNQFNNNNNKNNETAKATCCYRL